MLPLKMKKSGTALILLTVMGGAFILTTDALASSWTPNASEAVIENSTNIPIRIVTNPEKSSCTHDTENDYNNAVILPNDHLSMNIGYDGAPTCDASYNWWFHADLYNANTGAKIGFFSWNNSWKSDKDVWYSSCTASPGYSFTTLPKSGQGIINITSGSGTTDCG
jgi:hypothetical protein